MKVLIAEDTPMLQEMVSEYMEDWGYECDIASDGREAVTLATTRTGRYDICLMDIDMPVMNGYEATKEIRRNARYFPIMAVSGNENIAETWRSAGMDDYLEKPYPVNALYEKINELTVKVEKIYFEENNLCLKKEMPMDGEQLRELIELEKKGLALLIVEGGQQKFVVHKNIQNKMSHVLIGEGKELFEFLDRGDNPANCHLYKCNMQTNRLLLTPEQFEKKLEIENSDIDRYDSVVDRNHSAENDGQ